MSSEHECTHCGEKKPLGGIFWVITNSLHLEDFSLLTLDSTAPPTSRKSDSHTHQTAWAMREVLFYLSDCIIQVKEDHSRHYRHKLS